MTGTKCRGICDRHKISSSSYLDGQLKKCTVCNIFVIEIHEKCPCCNSKLRTNPRSPKDKRTKDGDEAFNNFDLFYSKAKFEQTLLTRFYHIPRLRKKIKTALIYYLEQAIIQLEIIKQERRQRPIYIKTKTKAVSNLIQISKES